MIFRHTEPLAAIAQVEASSNPVARTCWRWAFTLDPLDIDRPASSTVGIYQVDRCAARRSAR